MQKMGRLFLKLFLVTAIILPILFGNTPKTEAAIAFVQSTQKAQSSSTTNVLAFTSNNTGGNLIIATVTWNSGTITASIADSAGNSYSTAVGPTVVGLRSMQTWYAQNIAQNIASANTVTVTFSGTATSVLMIHEYSGLALTGALDQTSANSGTSTACDSGSVTTTSADELIYGVCGVASVSITKGASYTQREYRTNAMMSEDKIVSSTGSYSADFTTGSSVDWFAHIATFNPPPPTFTQSAYRLFANTNNATSTTALASQDTSYTLTSDGEAFRLKMLVHVDTANLSTSGETFKLQFATKSGTCDTAFSGETYADVTTSTAIAFNDNSTPADGDNTSSDGDDPTHSGHTVVLQDYEEANNFTNSVAGINTNQDGLWDFSLKDYSAGASTAYCFRIVKSSGTVLNTYNVVPEITTAGVATFTQSAYRLFANTDSATATTALTSQDGGYTLTSDGEAFRLKMLAHVDNANLAVSGQDFKLQFATRSGLCDAGMVGESWSDVTTTTAIAYNNNATPADGADTSADGDDPGHNGHTVVLQDYEEANNFTNSVAGINSGQDGLWDFSLKDYSAGASATYCFRAIKSDGTALDTYTQIPEITTSSTVAMSVTSRTTSSNSTDATSYTTASFTPTANSLLIALFTQGGPSEMTATISGGSLSWYSIDTLLWDNTPAFKKLYVFAAQVGSSPSSMTVTFDTGSDTMSYGGWSVFDVTGTDVANGVTQTFVQTVKSALEPTAATSMSLTLASASNSNNRPFLWVTHNASEATTYRTNWTEIGDTNHSNPVHGHESQWRSDTFETTASASWTTSAQFGGIAFEVKAITLAKSISLSISDTTIGFGTLSTSNARYATGDSLGTTTADTEAHTVTVNTTATNGYTLTVNGSTLTCSTCGNATISAIGGTSATSSPGTEQFGLRMVAVGGNGSVSSPYGTASQYALDTATFPDQVASCSSACITSTVYSARYIANIAPTTEAGSYTGTLTFIATGNF